MGQAAELEQGHSCQRDAHQPQGRDQPQPTVAQDLFEVHARHQHAQDDHGDGADGTAHHVQRILDDGRQLDVQQKQGGTRQNGDHVDVGEHLFQLKALFAAEHALGVAPQQKQLYRQKGTGVDHPFLAQHRRHDGNDQVAGVGVDHGGFFHGVQMQCVTQQVHHHDDTDVQQNRRRQRQQQPVQHIRGVLYLKGRDDHTGRDQVQRDQREGLAVLGVQQAPVHHRIAHKHNQKKREDLFCKDQTDHTSHVPFLLLQISPAGAVLQTTIIRRLRKSKRKCGFQNGIYKQQNTAC